MNAGILALARVAADALAALALAGAEADRDLETDASLRAFAVAQDAALDALVALDCAMVARGGVASVRTCEIKAMIRRIGCGRCSGAWALRVMAIAAEVCGG